MANKTSGAASAKKTAAKKAADPKAADPKAAAKEPEADQAAGGSASGEPEAATAMTKEGAAELVMRPVQRFGRDRKPVLDENKMPVFDMVPVTPEEVFAFAVRGDEVTVVTVDGRKLKGVVA